MATFPRGISRDDRILASRLARAARGEIIPTTPQYASKLPGDNQALRGIPAIGRGVSGAIPGSSPEWAIDAVRNVGLPSTETA